MKNFFLVSVAIGIFSGTTLTVKAQPSVNIEQVNTGTGQKRSAKFIDGIEIKAEPVAANKPVEQAGRKTADKNEGSAAIETFTSLQFKYAQLLDVEVESLSNITLFKEIEKWMGTRYRYGGATEKGIDCSAYAGTLVHSVFGLVLPRTARDQYANCIKLDKEQLQQGDLVFFNTRGGISHVGLYLGNGYFTHASTSIGVTISNLSETYWNKKFISGGRLTVPEICE
ncbi:MAG: C40 family peptidase [Ferruginibacter sp.]